MTYTTGMLVYSMMLHEMCSDEKKKNSSQIDNNLTNQSVFRSSNLIGWVRAKVHMYIQCVLSIRARALKSTLE